MSDHLSQSTCLEMLYPKTDEHVNPSVEVYHLVGKLSTVEILLPEMQHSTVYVCILPEMQHSTVYVCIPRSFLVIGVCNQGKNLGSPCILNVVITELCDCMRFYRTDRNIILL